MEVKMKKSELRKIIGAVVEYLEEQKGNGATKAQLIAELTQGLPEVEAKSIYRLIPKLADFSRRGIIKPKRGFFILKKYYVKPTMNKRIKKGKVDGLEVDVYKPFAEWLEKDVEGCGAAKPLGGAKIKLKWGNPDVIGIKVHETIDGLPHIEEVITAEIKNTDNSAALIEAFGQACTYRLFCHKTYVVIPKNASEDDKQRLDTLCNIMGIGLVLFVRLDHNNFDFEIRTRPQKSEPNMKYVRTIIGNEISELRVIAEGNRI
jgi:hypothetical protein